MKRMLIAIGIIFVMLSLVSFFTFSDVWLLPYATLVAAAVGLFYPFPYMTKVIILSILILSFVVIVYGFRNSSETKGQVSAVVGIIIWSLVGLLGLESVQV